MKLSTVVLSSLLFLFSSFAVASTTDLASDRAQVTTTSAAQTTAPTTIEDLLSDDAATNHACSCEGTQACSVSCAYDKSAKCWKDVYGYCSCVCQ